MLYMVTAAVAVVCFAYSAIKIYKYKHKQIPVPGATSDPASKPGPKKVTLAIEDANKNEESFRNILTTLSENNVKAVLFIDQEKVTNSNRHLLFRALRQGHSLGNQNQYNTRHMITNPVPYEIIYQYGYNNSYEQCESLLDDIYLRIDYSRKHYHLIDNMWKGYTADSSTNKVHVSKNIISFPYESLNYWYQILTVRSGDIMVLPNRDYTPSLINRLVVSLQKDGYEIGLL